MKVRPAFLALLLVTVALAAIVGCEPRQESPPPIAKLAALEPTCENVAKPAWPVTFDENGSRIQPAVRAVPGPHDLWDASEEQAFVRVPDGTPPNCWTLGWVPFTKIARAPDLPSIHEPVYRPGEEPKP